MCCSTIIKYEFIFELINFSLIFVLVETSNFEILLQEQISYFKVSDHEKFISKNENSTKLKCQEKTSPCINGNNS